MNKSSVDSSSVVSPQTDPAAAVLSLNIPGGLFGITSPASTDANQGSLVQSSIANSDNLSPTKNNNNSPSPGKRAEKQDVAAGLTASKGSLGSHKKKKNEPHHLFPPAIPKQNFAGLLEEHGR